VRGVGRALPGHGDLALDGGDQGGFLTGDEGAGALDDLEVEVEARAQDVRPEQAVLPRLSDGDLDALDGQRVFVADVDESLRGADGLGPDDHPFEDGVGVGLEDGAVHKGARVPFVAVADDVLRRPRLLGAGRPLLARGEARPAAAPQSRGGDLGQDRFGGHLGQGLAQRFVAVEGDVLFDLLRVDPAAVAEDDEPLVLEELNVPHLRDGLVLGRGDVHQLLDRPALEQVLFDEKGDILDLEELVEDTVRLDHDDGAPLAEAVAARGDDLDLVLETPLLDLLFEGLLDLEGPAGHTARAGADQ